MDQKLAADLFSGNDKALGAIWSESDYFANDSIARNFDRREVSSGNQSTGENTRARGN